MFHLLVTIVYFTFKQCDGQLGYGGNGHCSSCALSNSGAKSQGFGYGGGNYALLSSTVNTDLASRSLYPLSTSDDSFIPSRSSYSYGSDGYGIGSGYAGTQASSNPYYIFPSATGTSWNNAQSPVGIYGAGNGYTNCYSSNNCLPKTPSSGIASAGYGVSGSSAIYNPYSSLSGANFKTYSFPSTDSSYSSLGLFPNTYTSNNYPGLDSSYALPISYSSYPTEYSGSGGQDFGNSLSSFLFPPSYQNILKVAAADDVSRIEKSSGTKKMLPSSNSA